MNLKNAAKLLFCVALMTTGCGGTVPAGGTAPTGGVGIFEQYHFHHRESPAPSPTASGAPAGVGVPWIEGHTDGGWVNQFTGYGTVQLTSPSILSLKPLGTTSALITSTESFGDMNATISPMTTLAQLSSTPASWQVGWILWHYTDLQHFYYLLLMPHNWELGKEDPAYPGSQRYLVTSGAKGFPPGVPYNVQIAQTGGAIQVTVNGALLVQYTDTETPYLQGSIGLYSEEASVLFGNVSVNGSQIAY